MHKISTKMKSTSVDWIGEIPEAWSVKRLKFVATLAYGDSLSTEKRAEGEVQVYGSNGRVGTHDKANTVGKTIIVGRKGSFGKVNLSNEPVFAIDTTFFVDQRFTKENIDWLFYLLCSLRLDSFSKDSAVPGLAREDAYNKLCPVPTLREQEIIVSYLHRETTRIDQLVEKKTRQLELFEEKRIATITHAVTKGLNPFAPMMDSAVIWLGHIPKHWRVKKIKFAVSRVVDCLHTTPNYDGDLIYPAVRTADIERGRLLLDQARLVSEEIYRERIERLTPSEGDIVYSREGERFGFAALVPAGVNLCLGQRTMMFRSLSDVSPSFLMWALNSEAIYQQVLLYTGGSTSPHINIGDIINFCVACPPRDEQELIANHIDTACAKLDMHISNLRSGIERLQEYRSAIVTSAVTGKVDVRELEREEAAA